MKKQGTCSGYGGEEIIFKKKPVMQVTDAEKYCLKTSINYRLSVLKVDIEKISHEIDNIKCLVDELKVEK